MPQATSYDVVIVGAGLAGLQCCLALLREDEGRSLRIALVDPRDYSDNDKTWCYWDRSHDFGDLIYHEWSYAQVFPSSDDDTAEKARLIDLRPYRYKMIRSIDFYESALRQINQSPQVDRIRALATEVGDMQVNCDDGSLLTGRYILDSRLPDDLFSHSQSIMIHQHFLGWYIEIDKPLWNPDKMTMMDFRLQYGRSTSFCYVLPVSETKALIEYTLFTDSLLKHEDYQRLISAYIEKYVTTSKYKIIERESGVIPMSSYPFQQHNSTYYQRIGTAGGWVRASTGYSFYRSIVYSKAIAAAIVKSEALPRIAGSKWRERKMRFYDTLLLRILKDDNAIGAHIFYRFYQQRTLAAALPFLDGRSSIWQDLQIILSLPKKPFIKALVSR